MYPLHLLHVKVTDKQFADKHNLTTDYLYQVHAIDAYQTEDGSDDTRFLIVNRSKRFVWAPMSILIQARFDRKSLPTSPFVRSPKHDCANCR